MGGGGVPDCLLARRGQIVYHGRLHACSAQRSAGVGPCGRRGRAPRHATVLACMLTLAGLRGGVVAAQVKVVRAMKNVSLEDVVLGQYRARTTQVRHPPSLPGCMHGSSDGLQQQPAH